MMIIGNAVAVGTLCQVSGSLEARCNFYTRMHDAVIESAHSNLSCLLQG